VQIWYNDETDGARSVVGQESSGVKKFGKYLLYRHLRSEGVCIESFAARRGDTGDELEIRILKPPVAKDSPLLKRFVHELRMLARLRHPAIIRVLEAGVTDGRCFFTTPLRANIRLAEFLERRGSPLPPTDVLKCAEILTDAVALMHRANLVHRTLSPTSVHVDLGRKFPYIAECSAIRDIQTFSLTAEGYPSLATTAETPEGIAGRPLDERSDVFLLCAIFYRMLTLRPPFDDGTNVFAAFRGETDVPPIAPLSLDPAGGPMVEGLARLVMKGLDVDPERRFPSALALRDALRTLARGSAIILIDEDSRESEVAPPTDDEGSDASQDTEVLTRCQRRATPRGVEPPASRPPSPAPATDDRRVFPPEAVAAATLAGGAMAGAVAVALNFSALERPRAAAKTLAVGVIAIVLLTLVSIVVQARGLAMGLPFITVGIFTGFLAKVPTPVTERCLLLAYCTLWQWVVADTAQRLSRRFQGRDIDGLVARGAHPVTAGGAVALGLVTVLVVAGAAIGSGVLDHAVRAWLR